VSNLCDLYLLCNEVSSRKYLLPLTEENYSFGWKWYLEHDEILCMTCVCGKLSGKHSANWGTMLLATMWSMSAVPNRAQSHLCTCCKTRPATWAWCCSHHHSCSASVLCATAGAAEYRVKCTLQFPVTSAVILNSGHCTVMLNSVYLLRHIRFSSWKVSAISSIDIILVKQLQLHISGTLEVNCYTELAENGSKIACVEHCLAQLQCWFCLNGLALNHGKLNVKPFRFLCTSCLTLICQKVHNGKWCTL